MLYVGKATSLRQRVGSHYHSRSERAMDMLTQARDVSCSETETALEAALLEADEIKQLAPPFNIALSATGREVWFATADLRDPQARPDPDHPTGPLGSPAAVEALSALRAVLAAGEPAPLALRGRAVGVEPAHAPGPDAFADGLAWFVREHGPVTGRRGLLRLGACLWARRCAAAAAEAGPDETVSRAAHAVRRARWLCRLSESSLAWAEPGAAGLRLLEIQGGTVARRADLEPGAPVPVPPGHARTLADRRASFDVATFDRLRVLTTELRGLAAGTAAVEVRLGAHARLSRHRLRTVLRWV